MSDSYFDRYSWLTLGLAALILIIAALITIAAAQMPADGWLVNRGDYGRYTNPVYMTSLPATNPALQPGDILLEVDGQPFERLEAGAAALRLQRPPNWQIGKTVRYTLLRDDSEIVVPITLQRPPLALVYRPQILLENLSSLVSLIYLLMGGILFVLRPRQRASQLLLLFAIAYFVDDLMSWGVGVPPGIADLFSPLTYWPRMIMGNLLWLFFILPILLHLFLIFPVPKWPVRRYSLTIPLLYIFFFFAALLYILIAVSGHFISGLTYILIFVIPGMITIIVSLAHSLLTVKEPVPRMQLRWIAFGGLFGIAGPMIFYSVAASMVNTNPLLFAGPTSIGFGLSYLLFSAALPISLFVAVLRYRLWDIEIIINRSLVYGTLTAVLALIYFATIVLLQTLFRTLTGQGSPIAIIVSTLVIAGLFSPLRRRVQQFIDRRFYRRKYDATLTLSAFAAKTRDEMDLDTITAELLLAIDKTIQPESLSLWLKKPPRNGRAFGNGAAQSTHWRSRRSTSGSEPS